MSVSCTSHGERGYQPHCVYLDLNQWIYLAQAEAGTDERKQHGLALKAATDLVSAGEAIFPLSSEHFMEVAKIGDDTRRRKLAKLMVKLSQGWFLVSANSLLVEELRRAIARQFQRRFCGEENAAVTRSFRAAFGQPSQLGIRREFDDTIFHSPAILEELLATARVSREFVNRWNTFAKNHEEGRQLRWDVSRKIRKRAYCVLVTYDIQDHLASVLDEFDLRWKDLEDLGPERLVRLLESVPILDVEINLFTERNEHRDRRIEPNDEIDIAFLSVAVPYCRVVATEKFWANLVHRTKLDEKYGTYVGHDLNEILPHLRAE